MAMIEHAVLHARRTTSNDRKRRYSNGEARDVDSKRRTVEVSSSYGGVQSPSYPVSSLYHPRRDYNIRSQSQPRPKSEVADFPEEGYPGQYDHFRDYPLTQSHDAGSSFPPRQTKRNNRFNLSRYQLDDDDELASISVTDPEEKPNRFKTQRERVMLVADSEDEEEEKDDDDEEEDEVEEEEDDNDDDEEEEESRSLSLESQSQSQSQDSDMSQRERLRRFSSEHSRHVVIPNEWEGEQQLQEFVAFGNIEAALRPLGLMMARAALVSDSVTTRHRRSSSTGPSCRHTSLRNPQPS